MWRASVLVVAAVAAGCAGIGERSSPPGNTGSGPGRHEVTALVLESDDHGPMLCVGGVADSLPPQCGDIPITNWDWKEVSGEESMPGTTWGTYQVVGTYNGGSFTVLETGPPEADPAPVQDDPIDTPCPEPAGGWDVPDPVRTSEADRLAATRAAEAEPDFSGLWIDYADDTPTEEEVAAGEPGYVILNVAFTGDIERHTAELREVWGGPLCMVEHQRTHADLRDIQRDLGGSADELGIQVLWSSVDVVDNVVEVGVVTIDAGGRAALAERYGDDAVRVDTALTPLP